MRATARPSEQLTNLVGETAGDGQSDDHVVHGEWLGVVGDVQAGGLLVADSSAQRELVVAATVRADDVHALMDQFVGRVDAVGVARSGRTQVSCRGGLGQCLGQGVPGQRCALDPHGKLDDSLQRFEVAQFDVGPVDRRALRRRFLD